jgi:hypothetical protein
MAVRDAILDAYVATATIEDAEPELELLVPRSDELPVPLGDLYDELAEGAAQENRYDVDVRLQRNALHVGCR